MRIRILVPCILVSIIILSTIYHIPQVRAGPFRDYNALIAAFKNLANTYPSLVTFQTVGKTVENNDITVFKIGNPAGGKVLFDGAIHGWEALGSEVLYSYAKWLLTSNDPLAEQTIAGEYTLIIPAVDVDEYSIDRKNADGVDLNRNFATNWKYGSYNPDSTNYHGPSALSEPETQTLVRVFQTIKPDFYVNLHAGGAELYESAYGNRTYYLTLLGKMNSLSEQRGVNSYYTQFLNGSGFGINDAMRAGVTSFLLEVIDQSTVSPSEIETIVLPRFIPVAVVLSQESQNAHFGTSQWDLNEDGKVDVQDLAIVAAAYNSTPGSLNWNSLADVKIDGKIDITDLAIIAKHYEG